MHETDELIYSRYLAEHSDDDFRILLERHRESLMLFLMSFVHNTYHFYERKRLKWHVYYDSIMEKLYADYSLYFEEI